MDVLDPGDSAGLGGLSLWDGTTRIPLFGAASPQAKLTVITSGPVRGLVRADYPAVKTARGDITLTVYLSAFSANTYSRQDVVIATKSGAPVVLGPAVQKLPGETWSLDKAKGLLAAWGKGAGKAGEIGLSAIFSPADLFGMDDGGPDRAIKLAGRAGRKLTYWVAGAWERGVTSPDVPAAKNWARRVGDLAARLLVPVKIDFKAK